MTDYFEILIEPQRRFLTLRLKGAWNLDVFEAYAAAYRRAIEELNAHGGVAYSLVDASEYGELTPSIAARFPELILDSRPSATRRTAMIMSTIVNKAQSRDVSELLNARYFRTVGAATEWLFSSEA